MIEKELQTQNVLVLGDTHNLPAIYYYLNRYSITDFVLIQVGDCSIGFNRDKIEKSVLTNLQKYCEANNGYVVFVQGNHDYPFAYNRRYWANLLFDRIEFVENYSRKIINGKNFLFAGGAISIDRQQRINNKDWWPGEYFRLPDDLENLDECDVLITHSSGINQHPIGGLAKIQGWFIKDDTLKDELIKERSDIQLLIDKVNPKLYHCNGHFHESHIEHINGFVHKTLNIDEIYPLNI